MAATMRGSISSFRESERFAEGLYLYAEDDASPNPPGSF